MKLFFGLTILSHLLVMVGAFQPIVPFTHILQEMQRGQIEKVIMTGDMKEATLLEKSGSVEKVSGSVAAGRILQEALDHNIEVEYKNPFPEWITQGILSVPLFVVGWMLFQRLNPDFRQFEFEADKTIDDPLTFQDWGGSSEILRECRETLQYFLTPNELVEQPKGVLLEGPPGTGKTMLGRIIAHEAGVSFIAISASNFVELYVGMGSLRVRRLFEHARNKSPCIVFIDEIDAIGQKRMFSKVGNDEREQTLNQLLYEMDGFHKNSGVLVMAATNRKDVLDEALLRPGRFDKIIHIPLPDKTSRRKIMNIHCKDKKIKGEVDWEMFASQTEGFSGADLHQLINDAGIRSLRSNETSLTMGSLWQALERIQIGTVKDEDLRSEQTRRKVAIHEAGHVLMCLCAPDCFQLQKVSIQETHDGVGGYTMYVTSDEEDNMITKDFLNKQIQMLLGGRVAESVFYGDNHVSVGAHDDLMRSNELCRQMVSQFGMGTKLNNVVSPSEDEVSDRFLTLTDFDTLGILRSAMLETRRLVMKHKDFIQELADELVFDVSLSAEEVKQLWKQHDCSN